MSSGNGSSSKVSPQVPTLLQRITPPVQPIAFSQAFAQSPQAAGVTSPDLIDRRSGQTPTINERLRDATIAIRDAYGNLRGSN